MFPEGCDRCGQHVENGEGRYTPDGERVCADCAERSVD